MGWTYEGPYNIDAQRHEGFPLRSGPGTLVASCRCGWRGTEMLLIAPTDGEGGGEDDDRSEARLDWEFQHLHEVIEAAAGFWPAWADRVARLAAMAAVDAQAGRHRTARGALKRLATLMAKGRRMADESAAGST